MTAYILRLMLFLAILLLILPACLATRPARLPFSAAAGKAAYFAYAPVYAPDGKSVATARTRRDGPISAVLIWDVKTGKLRHRIVLPHRNDPGDVLFSPDSRLLAVAVTGEDESEIELYNVETGKRVRVLPVDWHAHYGSATRFGSIISMAFSPDGRTLAVATFKDQEWNDSTNPNASRVVVMSVATGRVVYIIGNDHCGSYAAAYSPDGKALVTLDDPLMITLRSPQTGRRRATFALAGTHRRWFAGSSSNAIIQFSADGRLLLINNDRVSLYSAHSLRLLWERKPNAGVAAAAFSPDGRVVAYAPVFDNSDTKQRFFIRFCNSRSGHVIGDISVRDDVLSIAFSPDGEWLTARTDSMTSVRQWLWKAALASSAHHNHSKVSISQVRSQAHLPM